MWMRVNVKFSRTTADGDLQTTEAGFRIPPQNVAITNDDIDVDDLAQQIQTQVDNFNTNGSGWVLEQVLGATISTTPYRPCEGSSYIPTPQRLSDKQCTINIKNEDNLCFLYAILAQTHPASYHKERTYHYTKYLNTLNIEGLTFPM